MKPNNLPQPSQAADKPDPEMEGYWSAFKAEELPNSFAKTAAWVRKAHQPATMAPASFLHTVYLFLLGTKLRVAYTIASLVLLLGACTYPVDVTEPMATVIRFDLDGSNVAAQKKIEQLAWLRQGQLVVDENTLNGQTIRSYRSTLPVTDAKVLETYKNQLVGIPGVTGLTLLPVSHSSTKPLYAAALQNILKIDMDATDMTAQELEKSLQEQLQKQGIQDLSIEVVTNEKGQRMIKTKLAQTPNQDFDVDLKVRDGKQVTHIQEKIKHQGDPSLPSNPMAMTDAELKAFVIKNHPELQLSADDVSINRLSDKIEITVQDQKDNVLKLMLK